MLLIFRHSLHQHRLLLSPKLSPLPRHYSNVVTLHWRRSCPSAVRWFGFVGGSGLAIATTVSLKSPVLCESASLQPGPGPSPSSSKPDGFLSSPPSSSVNLYQLSFGTVAGVCAGVFIKKGVKALAVFIGGIFVLIQYFNAHSLVRVDWTRASSKFENLFYTMEANGLRHPPTFLSLWRWFVDFLTTDFQPRASFLAGLALGIRVG